eukprot:240461-Chlamydomonas_euryale.AAC.2
MRCTPQRKTTDDHQHRLHKRQRASALVLRLVTGKTARRKGRKVAGVNPSASASPSANFQPGASTRRWHRQCHSFFLGAPLVGARRACRHKSLT